MQKLIFWNMGVADRSTRILKRRLLMNWY